MEPNTPVALRRNPAWTGRTVGRVLDGKVHVRFEGGGSGNFALEDLLPVQPQDKQWPPATEHKGAPA